MVEFKCPKPATHLGYLESGIVPAEYVPQIMWNFACNPTRQWCDFVSFNPDFPEEMLIFVKRIKRDDKLISELEAIVRSFLVELDDAVAHLRAVYIDKRERNESAGRAA